jgi:hypothetical protein
MPSPFIDHNHTSRTVHAKLEHCQKNFRPDCKLFHCCLLIGLNGSGLKGSKLKGFPPISGIFDRVERFSVHRSGFRRPGTNFKTLNENTFVLLKSIGETLIFDGTNPHFCIRKRMRSG